MLYKSFNIKNFKGVDGITIDFTNHRIITLVGLNESGKTTVMEAINLFYTSSQERKLSREAINLLRPKGIDFTGTISVGGSLILEENDLEKIKRYWKIALKKRSNLLLDNEFSITVKFNFKLHEFIKRESIWSLNLRTSTSKSSLYNSDKAAWSEIVQYMKTLIPEIIYYDDFILEVPDKIEMSDETTDEEEIELKNKDKTWQLALNDILKSVNPELNFNKHVVEIWDKDEDAAQQRLSQMERMLNNKITSKWRDLFGRNKTHFKEIRLSRKYTNNQLHISFKIVSENGNEFFVKERSKGFKWFFSFLLFTEFRKQRTDNILFLLDEPASNLNSSAQTKILDAIEDLSQNSLVLYSTHSHHLIKPQWLGGTYICINLSSEALSGNFYEDEDPKLTAHKYFHFVASGAGSDKVSYFQPILDALDYKQSLFEPAPSIIITEGRNDWSSFKYFCEVIFPNKFQLKFYPGDGADKLWDIIRLYLAWGSNFLVLLDGDPAGLKAKKAYIKEFGSFIDGKIFTLKDLVDIEGPTEDLISDKDKELIINTVFSDSYTKVKEKKDKLKSTLNHSILHLNKSKQQLNLTKETKQNFSSAFSKLEELINKN